MTKLKLRPPSKKLIGLLVVLSVAFTGGTAFIVSKAAGPFVALEPESAAVTTPAYVVNDTTASASKAIKFPGNKGTSAGGICTNPFASTSVARESIDIGSGGLLQVRNEAWNPDHGPQTIYACSEQSWYVLSNQPDLGGAVQTYPDTLYWVRTGKTINQYTTIKSTFAEEYPELGHWNAAYDIWLNDWSKEIMIWNEWNGKNGYWPGQATTTVTLDGVPYKFYYNGSVSYFYRATEVKSGSVDILAALKWLQANGYLTTSDILTQIEYGVEINGTVGTQRFDTTGFTLTIN